MTPLSAARANTSVRPLVPHLLHHNHRETTVRKAFRQAELPEEVVSLRRSFRSRARSTSKRLVRMYCVTSGILPSAKSTKRKKAAVLSTNVFFYMQRKVPYKRSKKDGKTGEGSIAMVRNVWKLGCVSQDMDSLRGSAVWSTLKGKRSSRSDLRLRYSPAAERSIKNPGNERSIARSNSVFYISRAQLLCSQIRGSLSRKDGKARRCSQNSMGLGKTRAQNPQKLLSKQGHVLVTRWIGLCQRRPQSNLRKEHLSWTLERQCTR